MNPMPGGCKTKHHDLQHHREQICSIDHKIILEVAKRMQHAEQIATLKCKHNIALFDTRVETQVLKRNSQYGASLNLPSGLTRELTALLITYSRRLQIAHNNRDNAGEYIDAEAKRISDSIKTKPTSHCTK